MRRTYLFVVVFAIALLASTKSVKADGWIELNIASSKSSDVHISSGPQAEFWYEELPGNGHVRVWTWSLMMDEYLKSLPTGIGLEAKLFVNASAGTNQILAVYRTGAEIQSKVRIDKHTYESQTPGFDRCRIGEKSGRMVFSVPVDNYTGVAFHRFYVLVKDGKRNDLRLLVLNIARKRNSTSEVTPVEWTTVPWPGKHRPTKGQLMRWMEQRAVGGEAAEDLDYQEPESEPAKTTGNQGEAAQGQQQRYFLPPGGFTDTLRKQIKGNLPELLNQDGEEGPEFEKVKFVVKVYRRGKPFRGSFYAQVGDSDRRWSGKPRVFLKGPKFPLQNRPGQIFYVRIEFLDGMVIERKLCAKAAGQVLIVSAEKR